MMRNLWIKVVVLLASVWAVVGGIIWWMNATQPTPERLDAYLSENSIEQQSGSQRVKTINRVADQLNGFTYDQRRDMRRGRKLDQFFRALTPEEQSRFLDLTLPAGFKQMMDAFNKMDAEKRQRFVERTLSDMRNREGEEAPPPDDPHVKKMVEQGLRSFYSDANAEVKMDLAPLIEQMQRNLQFGR